MTPAAMEARDRDADENVERRPRLGVALQMRAVGREVVGLLCLGSF